MNAHRIETLRVGAWSGPQWAVFDGDRLAGTVCARADGSWDAMRPETEPGGLRIFTRLPSRFAAAAALLPRRVVRSCPACGRETLVRFEWAHTALPAGLWYWRCALTGGCWAGPYVFPAVEEAS